MEDSYININFKKDAKEVYADNSNYYKIYYLDKIDKYFLATTVSWITYYQRYYIIEKEDYELLLNEKNEFEKKFEIIIKQKDGHLYKLIGSEALRDYCVNYSLINNQNSDINCFQDYVWWQEYLWAKILWNNNYYIVFPNVQISEEKEKSLQLKFFCNENNEQIMFGKYFEGKNIEDKGERVIKRSVLELLENEKFDFKDVFSICIGNTYIVQHRFIEYIGQYNHWDVDVKEGILKLDDKVYDVEFIGTTSDEDNCWFSSEIEKVIPDEYVDTMIQTRKILESLGMNELTQAKIPLTDSIDGYSLSMIYIAFAPIFSAYFNGSGSTSIYMFVKNLPNELFRKINSVEFTNGMLEIIGRFDVNHKLLVKSTLIQNEIEFEENENSIIAKFNEQSLIDVKFDNDNRIINILGNLSL